MSNRTQNIGITSKICRIVIALLLAVSVALCGFFVAAPDMASAVEFDSGGYAGEFMKGDDGSEIGWNSNVIVDTMDDDSIAEEDGTSFVSSLSNFLFGLGKMLIMLSIIFSCARFVGRGLLSLFMKDGQSWKSLSGLNILFQTSKERSNKNSSFNQHWVKDMLLETFIFLGIGIFSGVIVEIVAQLMLMFSDQLVSSANTAGVGTFSLGGIEVQTK